MTLFNELNLLPLFSKGCLNLSNIICGGTLYAPIFNFLIVILLITGIIIVILGSIGDTVITFTVVVINSATAIVQQFRAQKALESLREISGLLEEMPAEEGYPAYLPSKLSSFYERAGIVKLHGKDEFGKESTGSVTIIGSVSPPAGDFGEPVTATTKNFVQGIWALDAQLAYSKHYPAINWLNSYSNYPDYISDWWFERDIDWVEIDIDWLDCRNQVDGILSKDNELKYITQLIGEENLSDSQQLDVYIARLLKNAFLIQNAFDEIDNFTSINKLLGMVKIILLLFKESKELLNQGLYMEDIKTLKSITDILRINRSIPNENFEKIEKIKLNLLNEIESLKLTHGVIKK